MLSSNRYEFLNLKGLVNRGFCPITGKEIGHAHFYEIFGRIVYLSQQGVEECKEWTRKEHIKQYGKEPMSDERRKELSQQVKGNIGMKVFYWIFLSIVVLFLIKKCLS